MENWKVHFNGWNREKIPLLLNYVFLPFPLRFLQSFDVYRTFVVNATRNSKVNWIRYNISTRLQRWIECFLLREDEIKFSSPTSNWLIDSQLCMISSSSSLSCTACCSSSDVRCGCGKSSRVGIVCGWSGCGEYVYNLAGYCALCCWTFLAADFSRFDVREGMFQSQHISLMYCRKNLATNKQARHRLK